jgi:hypothetical protein
MYGGGHNLPMTQRDLKNRYVFSIFNNLAIYTPFDPRMFFRVGSPHHA